MGRVGAPTILRYFGAKWSIARWIVERLPEHESYVEPFFGSGAVFFNKSPRKIEVINDLNSEVVNFFRVLRDDRDGLMRVLDATPVARDEWRLSFDLTGADELERARRFAVRSWMSFGGMIDPVHAGFSSSKSARIGWNNLSSRLSAISHRVRHALIENADALKVIDKFGGAEVLLYVDPPYPQELRDPRGYINEISPEYYTRMLETLNDYPGPVALSGFPHPETYRACREWRRYSRGSHSNQNSPTREVLWVKEAS